MTFYLRLYYMLIAITLTFERNESVHLLFLIKQLKDFEGLIVIKPRDKVH